MKRYDLPTPQTISEGLQSFGYIPDANTANVLYYAMVLEKPLLIEGPAGAGKTELAKAFGKFLGRDLIRLQCYEGIDESKALYEWNYQKQLLHIQSVNSSDYVSTDADKEIYTEDFLLERPLLRAIRTEVPQILLIDEIDKSDEEFESFLLEILSDWQVSIPEIGTVRAQSIPFVILTSNNSRALSEALRRRCLYLYLDYPNEERELAILKLDFPDLLDALGTQALTFVRRVRLLRLKKHPSISEVLDWVRILDESGITHLSEESVTETLNILLKHQQDCIQVTQVMKQEHWLDGNDRT